MLNPLCQLHVQVQFISCPHVHAVVFLFGMNFPLFYFRQEIKINANLPFSYMYKPIWQVFKGEGEGKHLLHYNLLPFLTLIVPRASLFT